MRGKKPLSSVLLAAVAAAMACVGPATASAKGSGSFVSRSYKKQVEAMYGPAKRTRFKAFSTADIGVAGEMIVVDGDKNKGFFWDRKEDEIVVVMFINAADPLGVFVENLRPTDVISVREMAGMAAFSDYKAEKDAASGFIGLVADGVSAAKPELAPALKNAQKNAEKLFGLIPNKGKRRAADGRMRGKSSYARQEGGILVCLPGSGGTFESGGRGHWGLTDSPRWIKEGKGPRTDNRIPKHVIHAFFPIQPSNLFSADQSARHNTRKAGGTGALIVAPWDYKFEDNEGFYRVHVHIKRGEQIDPGKVVVLSKTPTGTAKLNRKNTRRPKVRDKRSR